MFGRKIRIQDLGLVLALAAAAIFASTAIAAKPAPYSPTLSVSGLPALTGTTSTTASSGSTNYVIAGCGYNASYGGVTTVVHTPAAISFAGQVPDANGCISVSNFWTQGSGHYVIDAFQTIGKKDVVVASTSFDLP
jgi:hypothetical protein